MGRRASADRPARMHVTEVRPGAVIRVVSEPIPFRPTVEFQEGESFLADLFWNDYETRIVLYPDANAVAFFYPPKAAAVNEGDRFVLGEVVGDVRTELELVLVTFRPADDRQGRERHPTDPENH